MISSIDLLNNFVKKAIFKLGRPRTKSQHQWALRVRRIHIAMSKANSRVKPMR